MSDLNTLFNKTDQVCSNVYLIDETLCLLNSLKIVNSNVVNLSAAINTIQKTANYFNDVYTLFATNSSSWLQANSNIKNNHEKWNMNYSLVSNLSSTWDNEFVLYYTTMYEIQDWKNNGNSYSDNIILNWLNVNFPTSDFANDQIISLYVNLYENYSFDMTKFSTSYYHDCKVPSRSMTIKCAACQPLPNRGCNRHGGKAGYGDCYNAYTACKNTITGGQTSGTCVGKGGKLLKLPSSGGVYSTSLIDRFSAKTVRLRYKKIGGSANWTKI